MKNSLKGWSHSWRCRIWWSHSFEKISASEITGCHLGNLVSLMDHCDFIPCFEGRHRKPSYQWDPMWTLSVPISPNLLQDLLFVDFLFVCFVFLLWFDDFLLYYASVLLLLIYVNLFCFSSAKLAWSFNWGWFFCFFILLIFFLLHEFRRNSYLLWPWRAIFVRIIHVYDFPGGSESKVSAYNAEDLGSFPGLGRSSGEGNGNPLQYSCLENPMERGAWQAPTVHGVAKSQTWLSDWTHSLTHSTCIVSGFNSFWCEGCFLLWILAPLFSVYAGHCPLDRSCHSCCGDQSLHWIWSRASSFFCGCHFPVRSRGLFLIIGAESLMFVSELHFWVLVLGWQDRSGPTGWGTRVFLHRSYSLVSVLCCVTFHLLCGLTKYTIVGTALDPTSTVRMSAIGPSVPQALFSQGHQCRSTEDRSQDLSSRLPGPSVGVLEASQPWPSGPAQLLHACAHKAHRC